MSEQVQKLFDSIAPKYDLLNSLLSFKIDSRWRRHAVGRLKEKKYEEILDLCAGTLALTKTLLTKNKNCHVTAIDFSEEMLKAGQESLPYGFLERVDVMKADALKLPFQENSYDAAMCAYGMRNIDDNDLMLQKLHFFLKPGGRLVVLEFFQPERLLSKMFNLTYAQVVIPVLGKVVSKNKAAYEYLRDSVRRYYTPSAFRELLMAHDFKIIDIKPLTGGITHLFVAETIK